MSIRNIFIVFFSIINLSLSAQQNAHNKRTVRILTFNILHGATTKGDFNLDVLANVIKEADPDLVAMQEVDYKTKRAKNYDLATELGWRTKMAPLFGRAMPFSGGEYGEAILSRWSFISSRNIALPYLPGKEPRAALLITTVIDSGDTISFIATHLDHEGSESRILQVNTINEELSKNRYPTILAGDLNDIPESETINTLEKLWTPSYNKENPAFTYPSTTPDRKIDYIMYSPAEKWKVINTKVICDSIASDHCAYLIELELLQ